MATTAFDMCCFGVVTLQPPFVQYLRRQDHLDETLSPICSVELPTGDEVLLHRRRFEGTSGRHVAIVAGIRGDTPEGVRVLHTVTSILRKVEVLAGRLDLYPCANPLAAHRASRRWPLFDVDLNRLFPGKAGGHPPNQVAHALVENVREAEVVIELRGANPAFREMPQAHTRIGRQRERELAEFANVEFVWERSPGPAAPATFAAQFENVVALEGGAGNRLMPGVGEELAVGVLNMLAHLEVISQDDVPRHWAGIHRARHVTDDQVHRVRAERGGFFLPAKPIGEAVSLGEVVGYVVEPTSAETREEIRAPADGYLLAIREQPLIVPGSMVARLVASS